MVTIDRCEPGYVLVGYSTLTCTGLLTWNENIPECVKPWQSVVKATKSPPSNEVTRLLATELQTIDCHAALLITVQQYSCCFITQALSWDNTTYNSVVINSRWFLIDSTISWNKLIIYSYTMNKSGVIWCYFTPLRCVFGHISRGEAEWNLGNTHRMGVK